MPITWPKRRLDELLSDLCPNLIHPVHRTPTSIWHTAETYYTDARDFRAELHRPTSLTLLGTCSFSIAADVFDLWCRGQSQSVSVWPRLQVETNLLLLRSAGPQKYRTYIKAEQRHIKPANRLTPPPTPKREKSGRENNIAPAARQLRAAALAANREAAYLG